MADVRPSEYMGFHSLESIILPEGLVSMQKIIISTMSAYSEKLIRFEHLEHADEEHRSILESRYIHSRVL